MQAKLEALCLSLGPDGNHLTDQGCFHLFHGLEKTVLDLREGKLGKPPKPAEAAASSIISGRSFYWRGFTSDRGSTSERLQPRAGRCWSRQPSSTADTLQQNGAGRNRRLCTRQRNPQEQAEGRSRERLLLNVKWHFVILFHSVPLTSACSTCQREKV
jgi:hypothetical protein